jgi:hypothetical protein
MFAEIAGVEINGLRDEAYKSSNYGNHLLMVKKMGPTQSYKPLTKPRKLV